MMGMIYTPQTLAARWECSVPYVLKLIRGGVLPAFTLGRAWRITLEDVEAYEACNNGADVFKKEPCDVYVIRCGDFVKIGKAEDIAKRIDSIQMANPYPIETIAILTEGDGHKLERELHRRFQKHRHRGEWFRVEGAVEDWIRSSLRFGELGKENVSAT